MLELVDQIVAKQLGAGDAGRIGAGLVQPSEGARRRRRRDAAAIFDPELRIGEGAFLAEPGVGRGPIVDITRERVAEVGDGLVVNGRKLVDDSVGVELTFHGPH